MNIGFLLLVLDQEHIFSPACVHLLNMESSSWRRLRLGSDILNVGLNFEVASRWKHMLSALTIRLFHSAKTLLVFPIVHVPTWIKTQ